MTAERFRLVPLAALLTAAAALSGPGYAQVPEGSAVICTHTLPGVLHIPGNPGLFLTALDGTPVTPITGLPAELTTDSGGAWGQGATSVSLRSGDGAIIVTTISGPLAPTAGVVNIWVFHLNGNAVDPAQTQSLALGTATISAGRAFNRVLPDDRILVAAGTDTGPFTNGPMAGHFVGVVDTSGATPTVTTLPNPVFAGNSFGGMAIAPAGDALYFVYSDKWYANPISTPTNAYVYRYDLTTGQTCLSATLNDESAFGITCYDDGTVYVNATNPGSSTHSIYSIVPDGCNPATVTAVQSSNLMLAWGLDLDRASGRFVAGSYPAPFPGPQFNAVSLIDNTLPGPANSTVIASAPAGGWGTLGRFGVAVNNAIESYSASSPGQNSYWFDNFPNPGGQPLLGNAGFTLTMRSDPGTAVLSLLGLSLGRASFPLLGIEVLLDPATAVLASVPATSPTTYALPIPNSPSLVGEEITAQGVHLEANLLFAATRGLSITIQ